MKKFLNFFVLTLMIVAGTAFTSCSKDDEPDNGPVVGIWLDDDESWVYTLYINKDGSFKEVATLDGEERRYFTGHWTYEEPVLTLYYEERVENGETTEVDWVEKYNYKNDKLYPFTGGDWYHRK